MTVYDPPHEGGSTGPTIDEVPDRGPQGLPIWLTVLVAIVLVAAGLGTAVALVRTKPTPAKEDEEATLVVVEVTQVRAGSRPVSMQLAGQVQPAQRVVVMPEVGGKVVWQNDELVPGGFLPKGAPLVRIDARDYALMVQQQEAQLASQRLALELEKGRRKVAQEEWDLFQQEREKLGLPEKKDEASQALALREPHLDSAEVGVKAAKSGIQQARLKLEKTTLTAPFNAFVQVDNVDNGQLVSPGYQLATLVGTDAFWVQVSIPIDKLRYVQLPSQGVPGSKAKVWVETGDARVEREGHVIRLLGDLDPVGRLARLLVQIDDPFLLERDPIADAGSDEKGATRPLPLLLGAFVRVSIAGLELDGVAEVPRIALHEGDKVYVVKDDDTLAIEQVHVVWGDDEVVLVTGSLKDGDRIVTSALATPVPGMKLKVRQARAADESPPASDRQGKAASGEPEAPAKDRL